MYTFIEKFIKRYLYFSEIQNLKIDEFNYSLKHFLRYFLLVKKGQKPRLIDVELFKGREEFF